MCSHIDEARLFAMRCDFSDPDQVCGHNFVLSHTCKSTSGRKKYRVLNTMMRTTIDIDEIFYQISTYRPTGINSIELFTRNHHYRIG